MIGITPISTTKQLPNTEKGQLLANSRRYAVHAWLPMQLPAASHLIQLGGTSSHLVQLGATSAS